MDHLGLGRLWRMLAAWLLALGVSSAHAGLSVYTSWSTLPPTSAANQRTVDFGPNTVAAEGASRMTASQSIGDCPRFLGLCLLGTYPGSVSVQSGSSLNGFSGNYLDIASGVNGNSTSYTITFTNPTPYVGFLWGAQYNIGSQNDMFVNITLADNSVVTLKNCRDSSNAQCVGAYVPTNWFTDVYDILFGWLFGDAIRYVPVYVQYQPDNGVKVKKIQFQTYDCGGCGLLFSDTNLDYQVDYLTYVDASVVPDHYEVTTSSGTVASGADVVYTIKACGNASCSLPWTSGVTGTLALAGATPSFPSGASFTIPAGPNNTATVIARFTATGTATASLSAYNPTPSNTPKVFCGMGAAAASAGSCAVTVTAPLHHLEVTTGSSSGLTCNPVTYTVKACSDAACSSLYTSGVTGTLTLAGATPSNALSFNTGGTGVVSYSVYTTTATTVTASINTATLNTTATGSPAVYCGMGTAATALGSCAYTAQSSALIFDVPHHAAGDVQTVGLYAIKSNAAGTKCSSAFSGSRAIKLSCAYSNPTSGTLPVVVNGVGLNAGGATGSACDAAGNTQTLTFDANGMATLNVSYADAGQMTVAASYTGSGADAGLSMSGNDTFVATPKSFAISTTGPYVAGQGYTGSVTAQNAAGATTPNFGRESPAATAAFTQSVSKPTGTAAKAGTLSGTLGAFNSGVATFSSLSWTEVGSLDFSVTASNYLGSGLSVTSTTGTAGAIGPFIPHHFDVAVTQACTASGKTAYTYAGQPFTVSVTAKNAAGGITQNYDGSSNTTPNQAKDVSLAAVTNGGTGTLAGTALGYASFGGGTGTLTTSTFTFSSKTTVPTAVTLRATEVAPGTVSSSNGTAEGAVSLRSGRLKLFNAFGSEKTPLVLQAQTQYWSGKGWVINSDDSCTTVPSSAVALNAFIGNTGSVTTNMASLGFTYAAPSALSFSGGTGALTLGAPSNGATGSFDLALNLGATAADQSCLSNHNASTGANRAWLRGQNGNCTSAADRDPSARATFGVFSPESTKSIHVRDLF